MKKTWLMSTCATALSFTASGEVNVYPQGSCCGAWSITWDLPTQRLHFETAFDYGYTVWVIDVAQVTTVTYDAEWLAATGGPPRVEGTGSYGFAPIATGFDGTDSWSGTFEIVPGSYLVTFYEFEGTLTFGDSCVTDSDGDGVCVLWRATLNTHIDPEVPGAIFKRVARESSECLLRHNRVDEEEEIEHGTN